MGTRFEVHAANDLTAAKIATKLTIHGALGLAADLLEDWDDLHVREYEEGSDIFKVVAKLSRKGLFA